MTKQSNQSNVKKAGPEAVLVGRANKQSAGRRISFQPFTNGRVQVSYYDHKGAWLGSDTKPAEIARLLYRDALKEYERATK